MIDLGDLPDKGAEMATATRTADLLSSCFQRSGRACGLRRHFSSSRAEAENLPYAARARIAPSPSVMLACGGDFGMPAFSDAHAVRKQRQLRFQ